MRKNALVMFTFIVVFLFLVSGFSVFTSPGAHNSRNVNKNNDIYDFSILPYEGISLKNGTQASNNMTVTLSLKPSNQAALSGLLYNLSDPYSPEYRHYITALQFDREFSPNLSYYTDLKNYFSGFGISDIKTFPNRLIITLSGTSRQFSEAFNVTILSSNNGSVFGPDGIPEMPQWAISGISGIQGISSASAAVSAPVLVEPADLNFSGVFQTSSLFPTPVSKGGVQYSYGSDYQVAYNETGLFTSSYDENVSIATILWSGYYNSSSGSSGSTVNVGPYNPADLGNYFNQSSSYPSNEPKPKFVAVPVDGAPLPSQSASKDTSGAVTENTLDLEMAGSLAPGSTVYNVYGPTSNLAYITDALNAVISNTSKTGLGNVSVVSMSFGTSDNVNSTWNGILQEAQARGITVLASSGDSGDNQNSPKYIASNSQFPSTYVQFPSSLAYDSYGVTAVGGTTLILNSNSLAIANQTVWYESSAYTNNQPLGTASGISAYYQEPSWQLNSEANPVISSYGSGRGVPDIAAVANNTLIYLTNSTGYSGTFILAGTSVASPVEAGIVATINQYLNSKGENNLGFLDPTIYRLGNDQYTTAGNRSKLANPTPFYNIIYGGNHLFSARTGYSLVAGMGSINAFAFAQDSITRTYHVYFNETGLTSGKEWSVSFNGIVYSGKSSSIEVNTTDGIQNYYIAPVGMMSPSPQVASLNISNSNITVKVVFSQGFAVKFIGSGLPAVNPLNGGQDSFTVYLNHSTESYETEYVSSTGGSYAYDVLPSGSYDYRAVASDMNYVVNRSSLTVNNSNITVPLNFTLGTFSITFVESGLPAKQRWSVYNGTKTLYSNNTTIRFISLGGSYDFEVNYSQNYVPSFLLTNLTTDGSNLTIDVSFTYGYYVNFTEAGLPQNTTWGVEQGLYLFTSNQSSMVLVFANGTYLFQMEKIRGYISSAPSSFTVNGHNVSITVYFSREQSLSGKMELLYALIALGIIAVIAVVFVSRKH